MRELRVSSDKITRRGARIGEASLEEDGESGENGRPLLSAVN